MTTKAQTAQAFANRDKARCHNAYTDGYSYYLHGYEIAKRTDNGLILDWCHHYTQTTAAHLNEILKAFRINKKLSYAKAREAQYKEIEILI